MRKFLTVMALCAAMVGFAANAGHAATIDVNGSYSGTEHWRSDPSCTTLRSFTDATGTIAPFGTTTLTLQLCITSGLSIASGTPFTLTASNGSLSGHVTSGTLTLIPPSATFTVAVTIDSGTGDFTRATGTLTIDGTANAGFGPPDTDVPATGTIVGQVTIPNPVPSSKAQCKDGGWRNYRDDDGHPFTSQGQCVSFVAQHHHS